MAYNCGPASRIEGPRIKDLEAAHTAANAVTLAMTPVLHRCDAGMQASTLGPPHGASASCRPMGVPISSGQPPRVPAATPACSRGPCTPARGSQPSARSTVAAAAEPSDKGLGRPVAGPLPPPPPSPLPKDLTQEVRARRGGRQHKHAVGCTRTPTQRTAHPREVSPSQIPSFRRWPARLSC